MTYKINYIINGNQEQIILFNLELAASTVSSLKSRGADQIILSTNGDTEQRNLKAAVETMDLAEQLELIQAFKDYIKYLDAKSS